MTAEEIVASYDTVRDFLAVLIADWRRLRDEIAWLKSASYRQGEQIADSAMLQEAAAVEAERAACEALARSYGSDQFADEDCHRIADAIAERGKP